MYVQQVLHERALIPNNPDRLFIRRSMWEGAVVGYGRCFTSGRRKSKVPDRFITELDPVLAARHRATRELRNWHVAHRVEPTFETVDVTAVFLNQTDNICSIRARVATRAGPENENDAAELQRLAFHLMNRVWRECSVPLEAELMTSEEPRSPALSRRAVPWVLGCQPDNQVIITVNPTG